MDAAKGNGNGVGIVAGSPSLVVPAKVHIGVDFHFANGRIDCQCSPGNALTYSQLIGIFSQLITQFAQLNQQAEQALFRRETERLVKGGAGG
jgi:hypothetical protein